jgi:hypothetical protein
MSRSSRCTMGLALAAALWLALVPATATTIVIGGAQVVEGSGKVVDEGRTVAPFTRVLVNGPVDVQLKRGAAEKATVHADDNIAPRIDVRVENGRLVVGTKKDASFRTRTKVFVTVEFRQLDALQLNGSGDASVDDLKATIFEGSIRGSGNVKIAKLDADTVAISIAGSGDFSASGRADKAGFVVEGSGDVNARDLQARTVAIRIAGSGDAVVCASETLQAHVAGSGDVRYCGSPRLEKKVSGSGGVKPIR